MCEFTQREYGCGHFKFIAARWCNLYKRTHRRCPPDVTHFEYRANEICAQCRPHKMPEWHRLIRINAPASITGIAAINSLDDCCRNLSLAQWAAADAAVRSRSTGRSSRGGRRAGAASTGAASTSAAADSSTRLRTRPLPPPYSASSPMPSHSPAAAELAEAALPTSHASPADALVGTAAADAATRLPSPPTPTPPLPADTLGLDSVLGKRQRDSCGGCVDGAMHR